MTDDTSPEGRSRFLASLRDPEPGYDGGGDFITRLARADEVAGRLQRELDTAAGELSYVIAQASPGARGATLDDAVERAEATAATRTQSPAERHALSVMWAAQAEWQAARTAYDQAARIRDRLLADYNAVMDECRLPPGRTGAVLDVLGVDYYSESPPVDRPTRYGR